MTRRSLVAGVWAEVWREWYICLLYVYYSEGGMQASREGWGAVVGSQGGAGVTASVSIRDGSSVTGILQIVL